MVMWTKSNNSGPCSIWCVRLISALPLLNYRLLSLFFYNANICLSVYILGYGMTKSPSGANLCCWAMSPRRLADQTEAVRVSEDSLLAGHVEICCSRWNHDSTGWHGDPPHSVGTPHVRFHKLLGQMLVINFRQLTDVRPNEVAD